MPIYIVAPDGSQITPYRFLGHNPPGIKVYARTELGARMKAPRYRPSRDTVVPVETPQIPSSAQQSAALITLPRGELGKIAERIASVIGALLDGAKGKKYVRVDRETLVELYQMSDELESKLGE